jgi:hypothetical protein
MVDPDVAERPRSASGGRGAIWETSAGQSGPTGVLGAKALVADHERVLVTSANLSEAPRPQHQVGSVWSANPHWPPTSAGSPKMRST